MSPFAQAKVCEKIYNDNTLESLYGKLAFAIGYKNFVPPERDGEGEREYVCVCVKTQRE